MHNTNEHLMLLYFCYICTTFMFTIILLTFLYIVKYLTHVQNPNFSCYMFEENILMFSVEAYSSICLNPPVEIMFDILSCICWTVYWLESLSLIEYILIQLRIFPRDSLPNS